MSVATEKEENNSQIDHEETAGRIKLRIKLKLSQNHLSEHQSLSKMDDHDEVDSEAISSDIEEENPLDNEAVLDESEPIPTCPECAKIFPSLKSLYGHLRSHPERRYRGVHKPLGVQKRPSCPIPNWGAKAKRGRPDLIGQEEVNIAAETLISMSQAKYTIDESLPKQVKSYQCSTCNKSFPTHQALGGHRASHNKIRSNLEGDASEGVKEAIVEHRCRTCNENFATGQALGGHMRRHYNFPIVKLGNHAPNGFDLNKMPQEEE